MPHLKPYLEDIAAKDRAVLKLLDREIKYKIENAYLGRELERKKPGTGPIYVPLQQLDGAYKMAFMIIGEKSKKISSQVKSANPKMPWKKLANMRVTLAHNVEFSLKDGYDYRDALHTYHEKFEKNELQGMAEFALKKDHKNPEDKVLATEIKNMGVIVTIIEQKTASLKSIEGEPYAEFSLNEKHNLGYILNQASNFSISNSSGIMEHLSPIFKKTLGEKDNFPDIQSFKRVRNFIDHDNVEEYIKVRTKEVNDFTSQQQKLVDLPKTIENYYLKSYHPQKNTMAVTEEGYNKELFSGFSSGKIKVIEDVVKSFTDKPDEQRNKDAEQIYLMALSKELRKIDTSDPKKIREVVNETAATVNKAPTVIKPVTPGTHNTMETIKKVSNTMYIYYDNVTKGRV